jgi:prevent-host-death family protein
MRTANIGTLKNQLSAYLKYVRNGEEVIICDRNVPIARITPLEAPTNYDAEEARLIAAGILIPPKDPTPMDWDAFWAIPTGNVSDQAIKDAMDWVKGDR